MASLSLVSVNVERSKHLDLILPFLERQAADVVCIQEICERDIPKFEFVLGKILAYAPLTVHPNHERAEVDQNDPVLEGIAMFSRLSVVKTAVTYYVGSEDGARNKPPHRVADDLPFMVCDIEKERAIFRIGTLHFTWTPNGEANDMQRAHLSALLPVLEATGEMVFCGDLNAPRGKEIFGEFAKRYKDNIPEHHSTSIDGSLHRAGQLPYMVDGLFSTPVYRVSGVELVPGVSDHCAIVATVSED